MQLLLYCVFIVYWRGWARTQTPTTRNCTVELPTFAVIAGVSPVRVQWKSLALEETPPWSDLLPRQVSMVFKSDMAQYRFLKTSTTLVAGKGVTWCYNAYRPSIQWKGYLKACYFHSLVAGHLPYAGHVYIPNFLSELLPAYCVPQADKVVNARLIWSICKFIASRPNG